MEERGEAGTADVSGSALSDRDSLASDLESASHNFPRRAAYGTERSFRQSVVRRLPGKLKDKRVSVISEQFPQLFSDKLLESGNRRQLFANLAGWAANTLNKQADIDLSQEEPVEEESTDIYGVKDVRQVFGSSEDQRLSAQETLQGQARKFQKIKQQAMEAAKVKEDYERVKLELAGVQFELDNLKKSLGADYTQSQADVRNLTSDNTRLMYENEEKNERIQALTKEKYTALNELKVELNSKIANLERENERYRKALTKEGILEAVEALERNRMATVAVGITQDNLQQELWDVMKEKWACEKLISDYKTELMRVKKEFRAQEEAHTKNTMELQKRVSELSEDLEKKKIYMAQQRETVQRVRMQSVQDRARQMMLDKELEKAASEQLMRLKLIAHRATTYIYAANQEEIQLLNKVLWTQTKRAVLNDSDMHMAQQRTPAWLLCNKLGNAILAVLNTEVKVLQGVGASLAARRKAGLAASKEEEANTEGLLQDVSAAVKEAVRVQEVTEEELERQMADLQRISKVQVAQFGSMSMSEAELAWYNTESGQELKNWVPEEERSRAVGAGQVGVACPQRGLHKAPGPGRAQDELARTRKQLNLLQRQRDKERAAEQRTAEDLAHSRGQLQRAVHDMRRLEDHVFALQQQAAALEQELGEEQQKRQGLEHTLARRHQITDHHPSLTAIPTQDAQDQARVDSGSCAGSEGSPSSAPGHQQPGSPQSEDAPSTSLGGGSSRPASAQSAREEGRAQPAVDAGAGGRGAVDVEGTPGARAEALAGRPHALPVRPASARSGPASHQPHLPPNQGFRSHRGPSPTTSKHLSDAVDIPIQNMKVVHMPPAEGPGDSKGSTPAAACSTTSSTQPRGHSPQSDATRTTLGATTVSGTSPLPTREESANLASPAAQQRAEGEGPHPLSTEQTVLTSSAGSTGNLRVGRERPGTAAEPVPTDPSAYAVLGGQLRLEAGSDSLRAYHSEVVVAGYSVGSHAMSASLQEDLDDLANSEQGVIWIRTSESTSQHPRHSATRSVDKNSTQMESSNSFDVLEGYKGPADIRCHSARHRTKPHFIVSARRRKQLAEDAQKLKEKHRLTPFK